jgi:hypothetical protein
VQLEISYHVPCRNLKRIVKKKNTAIGKLWKQLRFAFNVIFQILQYIIDVQIGEHISSIVKDGQGNVPVDPEGYGGV